MLNLKPFLKWVGGKTQIINTIISKIPTEINTYYEPFIGGGSVLLALLSATENGEKKIKHFIVSDKNKILIETYKTIKNHPDKLLTQLKKLSDKYYSKRSLTGKESLYYELRDLYNKSRTGIRRCALFIFLNKTCFRGLYREGPSGFNVGFGNYVNPAIYEKEKILEISKYLKKYRVIFKHSPYNYVLGSVKRGDFVYLDPPYYPVNETSFVKYHRNSFIEKDHNELLQFCEELNKKKIGFLMSNSNTKFNRKLYREFKIKKILCKRRIHSKTPQSNEMEVLIYNY